MGSRTLKAVLFCSLLPLVSAKANPTRTLVLKDADVGQIRTSLGYSTILQFNSKPTSVVAGDQDGFKVEYLANSVTIKPLVAGVTTNLFVFTEYDRFTFRLSSSRGEAPDYLVTVKRKSVDRSILPHVHNDQLVSIPIGQVARCKDLTLSIENVMHPQNRNWLIIPFTISEVGKGSPSKLTIHAENLSIADGDRKLPITNLYVEKSDQKGGSIEGTLLLRHEYRPGAALTLTYSPLLKETCDSLKVRLSKNKKAKGGPR